MPRLAVLFVLSSASSPCPDLNLIHYTKGRLKPFQTTFLLPSYPYLTATAAFAAAAAAVAFFRFEHEFSQEEEYAGEHNQADDNILSHDDSILEEIW